jgi:hypothetical protein
MNSRTAVIIMWQLPCRSKILQCIYHQLTEITGNSSTALIIILQLFNSCKILTAQLSGICVAAVSFCLLFASNYQN